MMLSSENNRPPNLTIFMVIMLAGESEQGQHKNQNEEGCQPPACKIWHKNVYASYKIWSRIFKVGLLPGVFLS